MFHMSFMVVFAISSFVGTTVFELSTRALKQYSWPAFISDIDSSKYTFISFMYTFSLKGL